jgi:hypothetical protein
MTAPVYRTRDETAAMFRISPRHLHDIVRQHEIPVLKLGRRVIFDAAAIAAVESACRSKSAAAPTLAHYGLPVPSVPLVRRKGSAFANALALMTPVSRARKPQR